MNESTSDNKMFPFATHIPSPGASTAREKGFEVRFRNVGNKERYVSTMIINYKYYIL
ncbi:hypothetical protein AN1V17_51500 [Vallitalea sediminicola]